MENQPIQNPILSNHFYIREACKEAGSLVSEGYVIRCKWYEPKLKVVMYTLKHMKNRNVMTIYATEKGLMIKKNSKVVKRIP